MNRFLVLLMSLVLALPVQALDLQGLYEQALTASRQGDFVEALPLWDRFLEQAPEDAAALSNRGNVRLALGDPSGAIDDQSASIVLAPEESDPHLNRGTAEEALRTGPRQRTTISGFWSAIRRMPRPSTTWPMCVARKGTGLRRESFMARLLSPAPASPWPARGKPWQPGKRGISIGRRQNCAN